MKKLVLILSVLVFVAGCNGTPQNSSNEENSYEKQEKSVYQNYVDIKYRDDDVDVADERFEELNTSKSSLVEGAWYDENNKYMVINLDGTYYHYCGMPSSDWYSFKVADSFGSHYNKNIKGSYDCRYNYIPNY